MILGTGIDVVEVARIRRAVEKFGERFLRRFCEPTKSPIAWRTNHTSCTKLPDSPLRKRSPTHWHRHRAQIGWQDIEIGRKESGEPFVILHGDGPKLLRQRSATCRYTGSHFEIR